MRNVSKNATEQDPFEASMGVYVFKRDVLVSLLLLLIFQDLSPSLAHVHNHW